jgi:hypothetical protein
MQDQRARAKWLAFRWYNMDEVGGGCEYEVMNYGGDWCCFKTC